MLNILYSVIIYPLFLIIEVIYKVFYKIFYNNGFSIIGISLTVTFLCLPLYIIAEKWQNRERDIIRSLKPKINKIKSVFKGDEQYMILSAYYRQNHYHPLYSLRNSFGILIQIPFFIAAYIFLSNLNLLKGSSFYFIKDLGAPDGLIQINGINLNLLPILMIIINCASGAIYSRNLFLKDKIQIYGTAAVFLLLLYNSPSGLVFYWTMNNVFSLLKNIFQLFKKPLKILYLISCFIVFLLAFYLLFFHYGNINKRLIFLFLTLLIPLLPILLKIYNFSIQTLFKSFFINDKTRMKIFFLTIINLSILTGFLIPSFVINSSPQEFSYIESISSPFTFLQFSFLQSIGFFIFWPVCIYFLFGRKVKTFISILMLLILLVSLVNSFVFSGNYGELSSMLTFSNAGLLLPSYGMALLNIFLLVLTVLILFLLLKIYKPVVFYSFLYIILISFISVSVFHSININKEYSRLTLIRNSYSDIEKSEVSPIFNFSKVGKNVIVIFLDRGINSFVSEIFNENNELYDQFLGFTYYPNTISYNGFTLIGAPPFFGGYDYTPMEINNRSSESLIKKHNEALLLMPVIFSNNNFSVTVTDPPWANYSWIPDIRIFSNHPEINIYNTIGSYTGIWLDKNDYNYLQLKSKTLTRNFFLFSIFKSVPIILREAVYNNGEWWDSEILSWDYSLMLINFNNYSVLDFLPLLTDSNSSSKNTFTLFCNELPHEPIYLEAPNYIPAQTITNYGTSKYSDIINYPVNAASLKLLGKWFEYLKQNDLYDNTRIIISSDHGADINTGIFTNSENIPYNKEIFNPILLVKDFNADFPLKTDFSFMTNADVPSIAFKDLIQNPVNPFTYKEIKEKSSQDLQFITTTSGWRPAEHNANTFRINNDEWYTVHSDIFNPDNWKRVAP